MTFIATVTIGARVLFAIQPVDESLAEMWFGNRRSKAQSHRHPDGVVQVKPRLITGRPALRRRGTVWLGGGEGARSGQLE